MELKAGPHAAVRGKGEGRADRWAGEGSGPTGLPGLREERKRKKKREMEGWAGWAGNQESEREKLSIFFQEKNKHIQI